MPFSAPPRPSGAPKFSNFDAVDRQRQQSLGRRKGNRRRQPAGILECGEVRPAVGLLVVAGAGRGARPRGVRVEALFQLGDQILQIVRLPRQRGGALALARRAPSRPRSAVFCRSSTSSASRWRSSASDAEIARRACRAPSAISLRTLHQLGEIGGQRFGLLRASRAARRRAASRCGPIAARLPGCTITAGGGRRPIRCRAASTSAITARRPSSDLRSVALAVVERLAARSSVSAIRSSTSRHAAGGVDQLLVELAAVVAERVDLALAVWLRSRSLCLLFGAQRFEFLIALLQGFTARAPPARGLRRRRLRRSARPAATRPSASDASDRPDHGRRRRDTMRHMRTGASDPIYASADPRGKALRIDARFNGQVRTRYSPDDRGGRTGS